MLNYLFNHITGGVSKEAKTKIDCTFIRRESNYIIKMLIFYATLNKNLGWQPQSVLKKRILFFELEIPILMKNLSH